MRIVCAAFLVVGFGCGDSDGSSTDGGASAADAGPVSGDEFRDQLPALLCDKIDACCEAPPVASCEDDVGAILDEIFAGLSETVVFDPVAAGQCLAAVRSIPDGCSPLIEASALYRPACKTVIHGTIQPGEVCSEVAECQDAPGAQGDTASGFSGCGLLGDEGEVTRCRRFNPTGDVGDECEKGFDGTESEVNLCLPTLSCSADKLCEPKPTLGQPCPQNDCVDSVCQGGICVEGAAAGESCESDRCAQGLVCDDGLTCAEESPADVYVGVCLGFECINSVCPSQAI